MKVYKLTSKYIKKYKIIVLFYLVISLILSILGVISPYISGSFIDNLILYPSPDIIYKFTAIYICIAFMQIIFSYISTMLTVKIQNKMIFDFNKDMVCKIHRLPLLFLDSQNVVYLNQRIKSDCTTLILFCLTSLSGLVINVLSFIICIIVIININLYISILILFLIVAYYVLYKLMKTPLTKIQYKLKESNAIYESELQQEYSKIRIMKIFNIYNLFYNKLQLAFNNLYLTSVKSTKFGFVFKSSDTIITMISQIILFIFGGMQILRGNLSIGLFTVLSSYFSNLITSTKFFINLGNQYIDSKVSAQRIMQLVDIKDEIIGATKLDCINNISIENLTFGYTNKKIITAFSTFFEKGKTYKIIGSNGKGKSTLINLIIGLYPSAYSGKISYNGLNLDLLDMQTIRSNHIRYIGQEPLIFNGTIRENIVLDNTNISDKEINNFIKLFKFNALSKLGYEEFMKIIINENNTNLSGGELKKISLIRGLVYHGSVLIIDEPSNSLDAQSKIELKQCLEMKKKSQIIIIISHDNCYDDIIDEFIEI